MWKSAIVLSSLLALTACNTTQQERSTLAGAGIGAGAGAVAGAIATGTPSGAAVGAAIGGVTGAIIGSVVGRPGYCYARDKYGNRIIVQCPPGWRG